MSKMDPQLLGGAQFMVPTNELYTTDNLETFTNNTVYVYDVEPYYGFIKVTLAAILNDIVEAAEFIKRYVK